MRDLIVLLELALFLGSPYFAYYKLYKFSRLSKNGVIYSLIASFFFAIFIITAVICSLSLLGFLSFGKEERITDDAVGFFFSSFFAFLIYASCSIKGKKHSKAENTRKEKNISPRNAYNENDDCIIIKYKDAEGNVSSRKIKVLKVYSDRVDAYCCLREQERTFIIDRIIDDVIDIQTGEVINKWEWFDRIGGTLYVNYDSISDEDFHKKYSTDFNLKSRSNFLSDSEYNAYLKSLPEKELKGKSIHFTGFDLEARHWLEDIAKSEGMIVRHSVSSTLDYCVIGPTRTPKKKKSFFEAKRLGIPTFDSGGHFFRQAITSPQFGGSSSEEKKDPHYLDGREILFTGFTRDIRLCLEDAARASGMVVKTKVTKNLSYLVCGSNDAPAKRLDAINVGASIVYGEEGFRSLLVD